MATKIKITDEYVMVTVEGLPEAEKKTMSTLGRITKAVTGAAAFMKTAFLGASAAVAGLMWKGFSGTREGEQFGQAMTYLARVVANEAAPALRIITVMIVKVADALRTLSPEAKNTVAIVAALAAALMLLGTGPFALIVIGATAAAAAILYFNDTVEKMKKNLQAGVFDSPTLGLRWLINQLPDGLKQAAIKSQPILGIMDRLKEKTDASFGNFAEKLVGIRNAVKDMFANANAAGPLRIKLQAELESPQATWDRIQKAFAEGKNELNPKLDEHLKGIRGALDKAVGAFGAVGGIGR